MSLNFCGFNWNYFWWLYIVLRFFFSAHSFSNTYISCVALLALNSCACGTFALSYQRLTWLEPKMPWARIFGNVRNRCLPITDWYIISKSKHCCNTLENLLILSRFHDCTLTHNLCLYPAENPVRWNETVPNNSKCDDYFLHIFWRSLGTDYTHHCLIFVLASTPDGKLLMLFERSL